MNLLIDASLSEPPTESLYFRYVTLVASENLNLNCLIEAEQTMKDLYYKYLLKQGLMDYIEAIVTPIEHVTGLRLGPTVNKAPAIKLKSIQSNSVIYLLGMIKGNIYGID